MGLLSVLNSAQKVRLARSFKAAEDSLTTYLERQPWAMQKEMVWFLWEE